MTSQRGPSGNKPRNKNMKQPPQDRTISGRLVIVVLLMLGTMGTVGSTWYRLHSQQRPIQLWGQGPANLMLNAAIVEAMQLVPAGSDEAAGAMKHLSFNGQRYAVVAQREVSGAPEFVHVRQALIHDASFDWSDTGQCKPVWQYGLEFSNGAESTLVLLAPDCGRALLVDTGASASIRPVMPGIVRLMEEQFPPKAAAPPAKATAPSGKTADEPKAPAKK
jgi:hypothetical protein